MDDPAVVRADGLHRFRHHPPSLVGCLGQVAIFPEMLPRFPAKVVAQSGIRRCGLERIAGARRIIGRPQPLCDSI